MEPEAGSSNLSPAKKDNNSTTAMVLTSKNGKFFPGISANTLIISTSQSVPSDSGVLLNNHANFEKSARPNRIMFFFNNEWVDFQPNVVENLKRLFASRNASSVVEIDRSRYLFDFYRMLQIDLGVGTRRWIAWIDVNGKCFFPQRFTDDGGFHSPPLKLEIQMKLKEGLEVDDDLKELSETQPLDVDLSGGPRLIQHNKEIGEPSNRVNLQETVALEAGARSSWKGKEIAMPLLTIEEGKIHEQGADGKIGSNHSVNTRKESEDSNSNSVNKEKEKVSGSNDNLPKANNGLLIDAKKENVGDGGNGILVNNNSAVGRRALGDNPEDTVAKRARISSLPAAGIAGGHVAAGFRPSFELLGSTRLLKVQERHGAYKAVMDLFLQGMRRVDPSTTVVSLHWCSFESKVGTTRMMAFRRSAEMMKTVRGKANVRFAWHGASPNTIESIVLHGFGHVETRTGAEAYGVGIYLSAESYSQLSASYSTPDGEGTFYVLLCRVIMGNMEQVNPGSRQSQPINVCFDSGVDSLRDPKTYVVWRNYMNTHILPEYVVSFRVSEQLQELWRRRKFYRDSFVVPASIGAWRGIAERISAPVQTILPVVPPITSIYPQGQINGRRNQVLPMVPPIPSIYPLEQRDGMPSIADTFLSIPFPELVAAMSGQISEANIARLHDVYNDCKAGRVAKDVLIRALKSIGGEKLVRAIICNLRRQASSDNGDVEDA